MTGRHESEGISVVIPTYRREQVLVDTIRMLLRQSRPADEILIVDQTPQHSAKVHEMMENLHRNGWINWIRREQASIPAAMNAGLAAACSTIVLYLDDDIRVEDGLIAAHLQAHLEFPDASAIAGQVLQPGETSARAPVPGPRVGLRADLDFPFFSNQGDWVRNAMAGNMSVRRNAALAIGGFDENFSGVAYRFETDFSRRLIGSGGKIRFYPQASVRHLREATGGTRSQGTHLTSASPLVSLGDYYFAFKHGRGTERWRYCLTRPFREISTRYHLRHPWWIPVKFLGEIRGFMAGRALAVRKSK